MGTDGPDPTPCDDEVFRKGIHVATWPSWGANCVEAFVQRIAELSGQRVDWHYAAGRVIVKALGDITKVMKTIEQLEPARKTLYRLYLKEEYHDKPHLLEVFGVS